jgi:hypothetical protein
MTSDTKNYEVYKDLKKQVVNFIEAANMKYFLQILTVKNSKIFKPSSHRQEVLFDFIDHKKRCCYKTVDIATAASQNGVCIHQGKCHK